MQAGVITAKINYSVTKSTFVFLPAALKIWFRVACSDLWLFDFQTWKSRWSPEGLFFRPRLVSEPARGKKKKKPDKIISKKKKELTLVLQICSTFQSSEQTKTEKCIHRQYSHSSSLCTYNDNIQGEIKIVSDEFSCNSDPAMRRHTVGILSTRLHTFENTAVFF